METSENDGVTAKQQQASSPSSSYCLESFHRHVCEICRSFILGESPQAPNVKILKSPSPWKTKEELCVVCCNLWNPSFITNQLYSTIRKESEPYSGGLENPKNIFCTSGCRKSTSNGSAPTVSISGEWMLRYHLACHVYYSHNNQKNYQSTSKPQQQNQTTRSTPYSVVLGKLKQHIHRCVDSVLTNQSSTSSSSTSSLKSSSSSSSLSQFSTIVQQEQQGFLSIHILIIPSKQQQSHITSYLSWLRNTNNKTNSHKKKSRKRKRQEQQPYQSQGGDPRTNLQCRLEGQGYDMQWTMSVMETTLESRAIRDCRQEHGIDDIWSLLIQTAIQPSSSSSSAAAVPHSENPSKSALNNLKDVASSSTTEQLYRHIPSVEFHAAVFRRPIYLYGYYTKSRRDISQTPFYVPIDDDNRDDGCKNDDEVVAGSNDSNEPIDETCTAQDGKSNGDMKDKDIGERKEELSSSNQPQQQGLQNHQGRPPRQKRLGISSVEEEICRPVEQLLGGISTLNNYSFSNNKTTGNKIDDEHDHETGSRSNGSVSSSSCGGGGVVYGMCKFHASGREDMNVRMVLRHPTGKDSSKADSFHKRNKQDAKGRPFCVQVIDALGPPPTLQDSLLRDMEHAINHTTTGMTLGEEDLTGNTDTNCYWYGHNPMGVGVEPNALTVVSSQAFGNLQSDTESKRKQYGCLVWTERELPTSQKSDTNLTELLLLSPAAAEEEEVKTTPSTAERDSSTTPIPTRFAANHLPIVLKQSTPLRVLHRRARAVRERRIYELEVTKIVDTHHFFLRLATQAGTYVKEFVHGDLQRTVPNLANMLGGYRTDLLELDCEGIQMMNSDDDAKNNDNNHES